MGHVWGSSTLAWLWVFMDVHVFGAVDAVDVLWINGTGWKKLVDFNSIFERTPKFNKPEISNALLDFEASKNIQVVVPHGEKRWEFTESFEMPGHWRQIMPDIVFCWGEVSCSVLVNWELKEASQLNLHHGCYTAVQECHLLPVGRCSQCVIGTMVGPSEFILADTSGWDMLKLYMLSYVVFWLFHSLEHLFIGQKLNNEEPFWGFKSGELFLFLNEVDIQHDRRNMDSNLGSGGTGPSGVWFHWGLTWWWLRNPNHQLVDSPI